MIANNFNDFFVNVGPKLARDFSHDTDEFYKYLKGNYNDSMFLCEISPDEVNRINWNINLAVVMMKLEAKL